MHFTVLRSSFLCLSYHHSLSFIALVHHFHWLLHISTHFVPTTALAFNRCIAIPLFIRHTFSSRRFVILDFLCDDSSRRSIKCPSLGSDASRSLVRCSMNLPRRMVTKQIARFECTWPPGCIFAIVTLSIAVLERRTLGVVPRQRRQAFGPCTHFSYFRANYPCLQY